MMAIDLDAYFKRLDYAGPRVPSLDTLRALHARHPQAIAFENLNPLLGWPVALDPPSLERKLVIEGRGGYCYEHNILFSHVLGDLGFDVTWLAARVLLNAPPDTAAARTHMLLLVAIDQQRYIADVGFGGLTLTAPLRFEMGVEQATPHEAFRLSPTSDEFLMEARIAGEWKALYRFGLQEQLLPDYEMANWYLSNHPTSKFVTGLMAARPDPDRRYALRNNLLSVHYLDGRTDRQILGDAASLREALATAFRLRLPDSPDLDRMLHRIASFSSTSVMS
jgi:N-hydroxyarylamine O-acetyltransferase